MRLFLDECLSSRVANELMAEEGYYVIHPRNQGGLGEADHTVLARCIEHDLIIVVGWHLTVRMRVFWRDFGS